MSKCKCIKGFSVEKCDDNGFTLENEYEVIEEGEIWEIDDSDFRMVGAEIRLVTDDLRWLEMPLDCFNECFEILLESEQDKLNKEIERLYLKIKDGTMEQNSIELFTYMWLPELRDRRLEEENISEFADYLIENASCAFEHQDRELLEKVLRDYKKIK